MGLACVSATAKDIIITLTSTIIASIVSLLMALIITQHQEKLRYKMSNYNEKRKAYIEYRFILYEIKRQYNNRHYHDSQCKQSISELKTQKSIAYYLGDRYYNFLEFLESYLTKVLESNSTNEILGIVKQYFKQINNYDEKEFTIISVINNEIDYIDNLLKEKEE